MIKVIETTNEYDIYSQGGLKSGETVFVKEDNSVHFLTNNIDGTTQVYNTYMEAPTPPSHDYEQDYLTFKIKTDDTITVSFESSLRTNYFNSISYSTDEGNTWTTINNVNYQSVSETISVNKGDKILWKGIGKTTVPSDGYYSSLHFYVHYPYDVEGNIMSLLNGDDFYHSEFDTNYIKQFAGLFNNSTIIDASNLILPATTLTQECYNRMFMNSIILLKAPKILPATTLTNSCYTGMFTQCTSLITAPELPATTLVDSCYKAMFSDCTALTIIPEDLLPATTLAPNCYETIFNGCSKLYIAPELPATTLADYCYHQMFCGCVKIKYIKMLATDISATSCLSNWVSGLSSTGTFVKDANTEIPTGTSGIPDGWTVQNA